MEEKDKIVDSNENVIGVVEDKKKTHKIFVLVLILIIIALVGYIGYDKLYANKVVNEDNNSSVNNNKIKPIEDKSKKEFIDSDKNEVLSIIGLTENGYKRMDEDSCLEFGIDTECINYSWLDVASKFIGLDEGLTYAKDINIDLKKEIIYTSPLSTDYFETVEAYENESHYCHAGAGYCKALSQDNYAKVARRYGFNVNGKTIFSEREIDNGLYLFNYGGTIINPARISDSITINARNDEVEVKYDVKIEFISNAFGAKNINKRIVYSFKLDNNNEYDLYQIRVVNK